METFNDIIINIMNDMDEIEKYEFLSQLSDMNKPIQKYNIPANKITECTSSLYQYEKYMWSSSKIINGVCYLVICLVNQNIQPTFHKHIGLNMITGIEKGIKKMGINYDA